MKRTTTMVSFPDDEDTSEDTVHTADNPYCADPACWCHSSVSYHEEVTDVLATTADEETVSTAWSFFGFGRR
jgi:hypothetical protein